MNEPIASGVEILAVEELLDSLSKPDLTLICSLRVNEDCFLNFAGIQHLTGLSRNSIAHSLAILRGENLVEFSNSLMTDDGEVAGSGYALTENGLRLRNILECGRSAAL